jgi:hypothetical protein
MALDLGIFLEGAQSTFKVKVSENDQQAQYLLDKLISSDGSVTITETNDGGVETIDLTSSSASPLTTKGDLYTYSTTDARLGVGTDGQALIADSAEATGLRWGTISADNMATADLTLTGNRTHDLNGNILKFDNGQVTIEGSGATSATTSLLVQNSLATQLLKIDDSGGFALGLNASSFGYQSVTIGNSSSTTANVSVAIGNSSSSTSLGAIAIGHLALANGSSNSPSIAIGQESDAAGFRAVALGWRANASGNYAVAIGESSSSTGGGVAISGTASLGLVAIKGTASAASAITIGGTASQQTAIAIGSTSQATNFGSVSLGYGAVASGQHSYIIRSGTSGTKTNSTNNSMEVWFGNLTDATFRYGNTVDGWLNSSGGFVFGATTVDVSAALQVDSTTKGFLPPRMTTTEKNAISTPATGLVVFDSTLAKICVYTGAAWETVTSA